MPQWSKHSRTVSCTAIVFSVISITAHFHWTVDLTTNIQSLLQKTGLKELAKLLLHMHVVCCYCLWPLVETLTNIYTPGCNGVNNTWMSSAKVGFKCDFNDQLQSNFQSLHSITIKYQSLIQSLSFTELQWCLSTTIRRVKMLPWPSRVRHRERGL